MRSYSLNVIITVAINFRRSVVSPPFVQSVVFFYKFPVRQIGKSFGIPFVPSTQTLRRKLKLQF